MLNYILDELKKIMAIDSPSGFTRKAADYIMQQLREFGFEPELTRKGCVLCCLGGEGSPVVFSAHIDTLGGMVSEVKNNGRLKLTRIGGMNANNAECENARVYTRDGKVFEGCFQMNNPSVHVNGEYDSQKRSYDNMELVLDENVFSADETQKLGIATGDYVCFDPRTRITETGYIKSRFLDDKLSAAILMGIAKAIKTEKLSLTRKVYIYLTVFEEVGHGCSYLPAPVSEVLAVDMGCVGEGLNCTERQVSICAKDSHGPYHYATVSALVAAAEEQGIDFAIDIYPHYGSDADAALDAGYDIRHALIGAGVYASHGYERSHIEGVRNTFELLKAYLD